MAIQLKISQAAVILAVAFFVSISNGCEGNGLPDVVPVSGVVTLNGKPLPNAKIRFYPELEDIDISHMIGSGVTDDNGQFTIVLPGKSESGAYACKSKVTVSEGPVPDELRSGDNNQTAAGDYRASLPNRPIPKNYSRVGKTPLTATVSSENGAYDFELSR